MNFFVHVLTKLIFAEFSLEEYKIIRKLRESAKTKILHCLFEDPTYKSCLKTMLDRYQLQRQDVEACAQTLYHELSKHVHGNTKELIVDDSEHSMTEVVALETVFSALKKKGCFKIPLKLVVE